METKKKVLFYVPEFPVLSQTFIQREIVKLKERGNVLVGVLALKKCKGELDPILDKSVCYSKLDLEDAIRGSFSAVFSPKKFFLLLRLLGKEKSFFYRFYMVLKSFGYAKTVSNLGPDFIIAHFMSDSSTMMMLVSKILDIPYAISAHAKDITVRPEYVSQKIDSAKFILICNKNAMNHLLKIYGKPADNVYLKYHGIDFSKLVTAVKPPKEYPEGPVILNVGRFYEKKGLRYLIEASKILKDRGMKHNVLIVGGGPLYEEYKKQINDLGVGDTVTLIGNEEGIPFSELKRYFKGASIFALPAFRTDSGDEDGLPNVLVEATSFGLPLVTTNAGSITDLVENEHSGIIVTKKSAAHLADGLERLLIDHDLSEKLVKNAQIRALKIFNLDDNVKEIEDFIFSSL